MLLQFKYRFGACCASFDVTDGFDNVPSFDGFAGINGLQCVMVLLAFDKFFVCAGLVGFEYFDDFDGFARFDVFSSS